jgi:histidine triad (HIT) family protein
VGIVVRGSCPFCDYDGPARIIWDCGEAYAIEPLNPVTDGHVLVIPSQHGPPNQSLVEALGAAVEYASDMSMGDHNIIVNIGENATQTIAHPHVHVIPRREHDGLMLPWSKT